MVRDEYAYRDQDRGPREPQANVGEEVRRGQREAQRQAHGHSADEIRRDIDRTRGDIDRTVDALQAKLSPDKLINGFMDWMREGRGSKESSRAMGVAEMVRDNPVPATLIGLGVGWLAVDRMRHKQRKTEQRELPEVTEQPRATAEPAALSSMGAASLPRSNPPASGVSAGSTPRASEASSSAAGGSPGGSSGGSSGGQDAKGRLREQAHRFSDQASEKWQEGREGASSAMHQAKERFGSAMSSMKGRLSHATESMREWGGGQSQSMREQWSEARMGMGNIRQSMRQRSQQARQTFEQHPLAFGIAAVGAGVLIGLLIPSSRREDQWFGDARNAAFRSTKRFGREMMHRGTEVAKSAGQAAREGSGIDDVPSAGDVVDRAKHTVEAVGDAASEEAKRQMMSPDEMESKESEVRQEVSEESRARQ